MAGAPHRFVIDGIGSDGSAVELETQASLAEAIAWSVGYTRRDWGGYSRIRVTDRKTKKAIYFDSPAFQDGYFTET